MAQVLKHRAVSHKKDVHTAQSQSGRPRIDAGPDKNRERVGVQDWTQWWIRGLSPEGLGPGNDRNIMLGALHQTGLQDFSLTGQRDNQVLVIEKPCRRSQVAPTDCKGSTSPLKKKPQRMVGRGGPGLPATGQHSEVAGDEAILLSNAARAEGAQGSGSVIARFLNG